VKDLSPADRVAIEHLLGRPISDRETVTVNAFEEPTISDEGREEIALELERLFAEIDAQRPPISPEDAEEIINEAMRSSRPNFRPIR